MHHPNLITAIINILCRPIETERNKSSIENENHSFYLQNSSAPADCTTAL
ncbi:hypothetical protein J4734_17415 [Klebsiella pneumoniae]|uniref:Uncharacterized protein n=1 Tax=Klebsiella pneumoniae TaxID=573 RepID=A0A939NSH8_KLEPN|nr:hypothetical protein [Klebsiella pneumoniae]